MSQSDEYVGHSGTDQYGATVAVAQARATPAAGGRGLGQGSRIGQYEIIRELGRGGMGRVLLARDTKLGRRVAIKVLGAASGSLAKRFINEARTTAQVTHENIVVIHEVNEHESSPYMVLEYLEGQPLSKVVREGGMPWARAVELVVPIVRALVRAHEYGVIHRDLKPDNVFLTSAGIIKVLDFGIAKAFADQAASDAPGAARSMDAIANLDVRLTHEGAILGTLPYMSPEQCGMDEVDYRTDLWAVGLILFELLTGQHPLAPVSAPKLFRSASQLDEPMPGIVGFVPDLPEVLAHAVDCCLRKRKVERFRSAQDLLAYIEPLMPGQYGRQIAEGESPYPGLAAFQESDASRFFGRGRDVVRMVARLREQPLVTVVGPSGVGKSSFVRAGVIPALKSTGDAWESFALRPGRDPIAALASMLHPLTASTSGSVTTKTAEYEALVARLRAEPGFLGTLLRGRARHKGGKILLFIDQFEELYTLVPSEADRLAFTRALTGVADDSATPLRVVLSMRSDFLDRVAEDERLMEDLTRGLILLAPPDRNGLREALIQPLELAGYRFESLHIVEEMLTALQSTPGSLPLLQFVAARLWDARDRERRMITSAAYTSIGGIAGALAVHADQALSQLSASGQQLARAVFQRLVTPDRTRAIVDVADLVGLTDNPAETQRVLDQLVAARLLVVQTRGEAQGPAVEIVHESLITTWPTLRRWLDETQEDAAFVAQLQTAAKQWDSRGRPNGLLWRGDTTLEAQRWRDRSARQVAPREQQYLDAVFSLSTRSRRIKRFAVVGTIVILSILVAASAFALVVIRNAEQDAKDNATRAEAEAERARKEQDEARRLQQVSDDQQGEIAEKDSQVETGEKELRKKNIELEDALETAQAEKTRAETERETAVDERKKAREAEKKARDAEAKAKDAEKKVRKLLEEKQEEIDKLKKLNRRFDD